MAVLELRELVKHYRLGDSEPIHAVDGVSLRVAAGELAVVYGPSGSGKTTLLELIAGLTEPDGGTVLVRGRDVFAMSRRESDEYRLRILGIVGAPQNLLPGVPAIHNASLKLLLTGGRERRGQVVALMKRLGLSGRLEHRTEELSMGERQRVLIARALAADPKLMLADEPTGNLDTRRTREVLGLLRELAAEREMTVLLATHDPQAAEFADRAYELRDGRLRDYEPERPWESALEPSRIMARLSEVVPEPGLEAQPPSSGALPPSSGAPPRSSRVTPDSCSTP